MEENEEDVKPEESVHTPDKKDPKCKRCAFFKGTCLNNAPEVSMNCGYLAKDKKTIIRRELENYEIRVSNQCATIATKNRMYSVSFGLGTFGMGLVNALLQKNNEEGDRALLNLATVLFASDNMIMSNKDYVEHCTRFMSNLIDNQPLSEEKTEMDDK